MICEKKFTLLENYPVGQKGWHKIICADDKFSVTELWHLGDIGVKPGQTFQGTVTVPQDARCRLDKFSL